MEDVIFINKKLRKQKSKLAIFDVDWTLIKPKEGRRFPTDKTDWQWLRESVPATIKKYHRDKYRIVFLTDQSKEWKVEMIKDIISILDIPVIAIIAMKKEHHKPNKYLFESYFTEFDKDTSFFVGDAAGREGDWAASDKEVAANLGIKFYTPEEIFPLKIKKLTIKPSKEKEVIIMVGYPGSGKSTLANSFKNYKVINGDILKTPQRMVQEAEKYLDHSIIFDATNGTIEKRKYFIDFAEKHKLPVRCIWVNTTIEQAMEQNKQRAMNGGPKVPDVVFYVYRKKFEEPTNKECKIILVNDIGYS